MHVLYIDSTSLHICYVDKGPYKCSITFITGLLFDLVTFPPCLLYYILSPSYVDPITDCISIHTEAPCLGTLYYCHVYTLKNEAHLMHQQTGHNHLMIQSTEMASCTLAGSW